MNPAGILSHHVGEFADAAVAGDGQRAWDVMLQLQAKGIGQRRIVCGVLAPAQRRIGHRWEAGMLSVGQEHVATAITEQCLDHLVEPAEFPRGGRVLVAGTADQWHSLPTRMVCGAWRQAGLDPVLVTPSLLAADLYEVAHQDDASVAGISCTLPSHLVRAWQAIGALRTAGLRVVVGGRAFDAYPHLAERLGADAYGADPFDAAVVVADWADRPKQVREPGELATWSVVARTLADFETIVAGACVLLAARNHAGDAVAAGREHMVLLLGAAISAALVGEPDVIIDQVAWLRGRILAQGGGLPEVWVIMDSLQRAMPSYTAPVRDLLRVGMQ